MRTRPTTRRAANRWAVLRRRPVLWWESLSPSQLFVGSFAVLVALGTLGLKLLPGLYTGEELSWIDALFTAVSAVCVTGLIVVDTATYFTTWGQAFILLLIQLGGLGIITFTTLIILALGRRLSLRQQALSTGTVEAAPHVDTRQLARGVVRYTLLFEAVGAAVLFLLWLPRYGLAEAAWHGVFHAVSAFCNAGFSTFSDSLIGFQTAPFILATVGALIVLGGLGFLTIEELRGWSLARRRRRVYRLSLHSRLALLTTAGLVAGGAVFFTTLEWTVSFQGLPAWARVANGLFMSITPRTAGFNNVDYAEATPASNFLTILLMFVGGSPGSTAGGIKTTTFILVGLLAWTRFRGREITSIWGRSVPEETIQRAVGLLTVAFTVVTLAIFVYVSQEIGARSFQTEQGQFLAYMFEAVSAFNTVGLSMGVTGTLSIAGKWLTVLLMFVGRVGPLTFAAAIALQAPEPSGEFRYAYEDVIIG